jgi:uncharacterized membrane protein
MLAEQIYHISILLFILTVLVTILITAFMFNTLIYIYSDRIVKQFKNKYVIWYINITKKIIGFELFFIGSNIFFLMYSLSKGIQFYSYPPYYDHLNCRSFYHCFMFSLTII